jgi:hypothetical protein
MFVNGRVYGTLLTDWLYGYVSRPHSLESTNETINGLLTIKHVVRFKNTD